MIFARKLTLTISGRSSAWLERMVWDHEVEGSNPFAPTILKNGPFGADVEGLFYCAAKTYAIERAVQEHDSSVRRFSNRSGASHLCISVCERSKVFYFVV